MRYYARPSPPFIYLSGRHAFFARSIDSAFHSTYAFSRSRPIADPNPPTPNRYAGGQSVTRRDEKLGTQEQKSQEEGRRYFRVSTQRRKEIDGMDVFIP